MPKYVVRYGIMRSLGVLSVRGAMSYLRGEQVVARTRRGLEIGEILCEANPEAVPEVNAMEQGEILRKMTANDANELAHIDSEAGSEFQKCREYVKRLGLDMNLVDIERVFGGERIIIYYLSEDRVDFRELVRQLAREFQTRIEMRQIGVRDEAKLLADYGDCGKPVCCNTHLTSMPPVSMKMAKLQKATLDPTKISGRCGRLKCCLRYEYDTYVELQKELPPVGSEIVTADGKAVVLGQEILASQLLIENEGNRRSVIDATEVISVTRVGRGKRIGGRSKRGGKNRKQAESGKNPKSAESGKSEPANPASAKSESTKANRQPEEPTKAPDGETAQSKENSENSKSSENENKGKDQA